jgi:hypothetical protein
MGEQIREIEGESDGGKEGVGERERGGERERKRERERVSHWKADNYIHNVYSDTMPVKANHITNN